MKFRKGGTGTLQRPWIEGSAWTQRQRDANFHCGHNVVVESIGCQCDPMTLIIGTALGEARQMKVEDRNWLPMARTTTRMDTK